MTAAEDASRRAGIDGGERHPLVPALAPQMLSDAAPTVANWFSPSRDACKLFDSRVTFTCCVYAARRSLDACGRSELVCWRAGNSECVKAFCE